jgi:hypothetical protein
MHTLIRKKMSLGQDAEVKLSWKHDSERMALDDGAALQTIALSAGHSRQRQRMTSQAFQFMLVPSCPL